MVEVQTQHRAHSLDALVDALDSIIDGGAAVMGDVVISVAGIELIQLDLRALLMAVSAESGEPASSSRSAPQPAPVGNS